MISLLDRYIGRTVLGSTAMVLLVLLGLLTIVQIFDGINQIGKGSYTLGTMLTLVALQLPSRIYEIFPIATLVGGTAGLSLLALNYELIAIRAGGVSLTRIVASVMKVSAVFIVIAVLLGELVVPITGDLAERTRAEALDSGLARKQAGIWFRDGSEFVSVGEVLPDLTLRNIRIYRFDASGRLRLQRHAAQARYHEKKWLLTDIRTSHLDDRQIRSDQERDVVWQTGLTPRLVGVFTAHPQLMPSWSLYRYIRHLHANQQDTTRYQMAFWNKVFLPISTVVMLLVAIPFVFGQLRTGGLGIRIFIGIMLGMFYGFLQGGLGVYGIVGHLGLLYGLPPVISAVIPVALFLVLAIVLMRRIV
ncbi:MAG: LPS export ABC transporter permease LptG [Acidiferrobacterales bacterium]|jgi:lipopolysaccharide export system permease protein|nr:LPS export ABC transporter permease LptG [Acidiferrobacterales bacterium]